MNSPKLSRDRQGAERADRSLTVPAQRSCIVSAALSKYLEDPENQARRFSWIIIVLKIESGHVRADGCVSERLATVSSNGG
ncbi:MAG TPA: hypothetical protein VKI65_09455, partial [Gemmataceae bacterium]|nr:hypothetical protein [Gemmataceae bacterium]